MKALVLNSGGVDSTTCVGIAINELGAENVSTVSIVYGQKHIKELESAKNVSNYYNIANYVLDLSQVFQYSDCSLLQHSKNSIIHKSYDEQIKENGEGRVDTYVPFRNGLMLSAVTSLADSLYPNEKIDIYYGAHADDACGNAYADCSEEFAGYMNKAINVGTYGNISVKRPLINMNKSEVVKLGKSLKVPYNLTWSCYEGGEKHCGQCGTCIDRNKAFRDNELDELI